ncbi:MAG: NAD(P)H-hydrate epimerase [Acidimicrobiia bacterium]
MSVRSFVTDAGITVPAITTDQMREVDRLAVEEVGPNLFQMMENAGRSLALTVLERVERQSDRKSVVVLAGTGGNGGGGICAARHLANHGVDVTVVVTDPEGLGLVPAVQLDVYRGTDGALATPGQVRQLEAALVVDALVGYSLSGPPQELVADLIGWANDQPAPVVALDVPSGIDATTGAAAGAHVHADVTLTLALPKTGLDAAAVGDLWLADLGIPMTVFRRLGIPVPAGLFAGGYRVRLSPA